MQQVGITKSAFIRAASFRNQIYHIPEVVPLGIEIITQIHLVVAEIDQISSRHREVVVIDYLSILIDLDGPVGVSENETGELA